jgi:predicted component of type VI protein secretion system
VSVSLQNLFAQRFKNFAEPMAVGDCAIALCQHHEAVQRAKSAEGKRAWFDRLGPDRIYIRHAYRDPRPDIQPGRYVHDYRGKPIRRFYFDLS